MATSNFLHLLLEFRQKKECGFLVLIDPDKYSSGDLKKLAVSKACGFLIGGSLLTTGNIAKLVKELKALTKKPIFLFPGHSIQICEEVDGILLPSLISGRNAEYLIGQHVHASYAIDRSGMEVISCGYLLTGDGSLSATQYITQTIPLPIDKAELILATSLAGTQLGLQTIYLEAGSGSGKAIPGALVKTIFEKIKVPLLVGGGIKDIETATDLKNNGATVIVIGNALEKNINFIEELNQLFS